MIPLNFQKNDKHNTQIVLLGYSHSDKIFCGKLR